MEDKIVHEIHEVRRRIFEECGQDIDRYIERLRAGDAKHKDRVVSVEQVRERAHESQAET